MYHILYNLKTLKVEHIYNKPLTASVCDNFYEINGVAEYNGEIPKNNWLTVDNIREEIETWKEKELNEQGQEVEIEYSTTHILCDLVAHFYPKREPSEKQKAQARIKVLKEQLEALDYKTNKYVEGNLSEEEWQETIAQRQAYREEINRLEMLL